MFLQTKFFLRISVIIAVHNILSDQEWVQLLFAMVKISSSRKLRMQTLREQDKRHCTSISNKNGNCAKWKKMPADWLLRVGDQTSARRHRMRTGYCDLVGVNTSLLTRRWKSGIHLSTEQSAAELVIDAWSLSEASSKAKFLNWKMHCWRLVTSCHRVKSRKRCRIVETGSESARTEMGSFEHFTVTVKTVHYTARWAATQCIVISPVCGGRAGGVGLLPR